MRRAAVRWASADAHCCDLFHTFAASLTHRKADVPLWSRRCFRWKANGALPMFGHPVRVSPPICTCRNNRVTAACRPMTTGLPWLAISTLLSSEPCTLDSQAHRRFGHRERRGHVYETESIPAIAYIPQVDSELKQQLNGCTDVNVELQYINLAGKRCTVIAMSRLLVCRFCQSSSHCLLPQGACERTWTADAGLQERRSCVRDRGNQCLGKACPR